MVHSTRRRILLVSVVALALFRLVPDNVTATGAQAPDPVPAFTLDASWPKPLKMATDSKGNIYTVDGYSRGPQKFHLNAPGGSASR